MTFKPQHPEYQYLNLVHHIIENGDQRMDRTGVGTRSIFGTSMRFDLSDGTFPLLTTKKVLWKAAVKEMLWFLTGNTNIRPLLRENVRIWSDWPLASYRKATGKKISQEEFETRILADNVFAQQWGDLGPVYGKQWRRWQGPDGTEHDQIANVIEQLKNNPTSRRILFHGWNVADLDKMALPPCHLLYQFHVSSGKPGSTKNLLNLLVFQRSVDCGLGLPFNAIGSAALLRMTAQQTDLEPGELVWFGGDTHIYLNHIEPLKEQLTREPRPFPKIRLLRKPDSIDGYTIDDFELTGYDPHPAIKMDVAV